MAELQQLQDFEIPAGREALRGNHGALLRVADYCEDNYVKATDKRKALEETMAFATQALASVAYQVGNLAGHTLRMLDLQSTALRQVEARVSALGQMVDMHLEKVARREIGTLAAVQRLYPGQKVIAPSSLPPLEPYCRRPINFGCLDDIGHGVKVCLSVVGGQDALAHPCLSLQAATWPDLCAAWEAEAGGSHKCKASLSCTMRPGHNLWDLSTQLSRTGTLGRRSIKAPAAPASATLGRAPRVPEPVQPPVRPDGRLSAASSASSLSLASASAEGVPGGTPAPPPPPPPAEDFLPPPPLPGELCLPPPELLEPPELDDLGLPPPPPGFGPEEPSWTPDAYLEKVVTLYPYTRQKDNELSFAEGTVICVTRRYSDGWCEGVSAEGTGFFPGNYVVPTC
ncbi:ABI gene family member 3 isoform X2 [Cavia porcellus]|uniref:ABI gene family member 3 isoform X2 n=1 Tax=Cavia porcellus TaxID=10141 RepID=UPI002FE104CE